ncbi:dihydroxyacetone phosphate acyltransferase isoform X1 [Polypterus senegalus]|uniref:dihydroxyacetone phosphate acyltransferase isoform X1 n=1 Tax=Polypterus senegalus TaxID=55291 RepID=UPI001962CA3F|nr:dihydroxyacetone phosphate acyltransferase isoform X1 [Polypterus senegalus]
MASENAYSPQDPTLKKRDDFEDILEERRNSSDVKYALRCYTPVLYNGVPPCKASLLKHTVLKSDHVLFVIQQLSKESGESPEIIHEEAVEILDEMAQNLKLSVVRFFAFMLSKAFKTLFQRVRVNEEGIQRLQQAIQQYPVVLLPSHRSYIDFLMLSYVLYTYDLSLPVIASGMDFLGMKIVGEMLRMSGAFFIRRSFGGDKLYWALFSEYVKTMLRKGYAPIEFFLEGTRSRTCKSLVPKLGLLNIVMEPFFKGEVFDVSLVPISISYERILEESLYAYELLGVPKPKESTSGLLKARKILSDDFGSIHVYFGHPVSLRSLAQGKISRSYCNLIPRHIPVKPPKDIFTFVNDIGYKMVRLQQENMVISPWVLVASILIQSLPQIDINHLTEQTVWLRNLAQSFGASVDWPDHISVSKVVASSISLHHSIVRNIGGRVTLIEEKQESSNLEHQLFNYAATVLMCASYRNQILHIFVRPALVAISVHSVGSSRKEEIFSYFSFLRDIFSYEFIFAPGHAIQDFEEGCYLLMKADAIQILKTDILLSERGHKIVSFFISMFQPFVEGYQVVCRYLSEEALEGVTENQYVSAVRKFAVKRLLSGAIKSCEVLSSDLQKNALAALLKLNICRKTKEMEQVVVKVNRTAVNSVEDTLGRKLTPQKTTLARL